MIYILCMRRFLGQYVGVDVIVLRWKKKEGLGVRQSFDRSLKPCLI